MTIDDAQPRPVQDSWRDNACFGCGLKADGAVTARREQTAVGTN